MANRATGTFETTRWEEESLAEVAGGPRLARASVANVFQGDIEGETTLAYLLCYLDDGRCVFHGLEQVTGRVGDRVGSFVLHHAGIFRDGAAEATSSVVPGSGSGDLRGLRGAGGFVARQGVAATPFTLDYDID